VQLDDRDAVAAKLKAVGIPTAVHYPMPLHRQPAYRDLTRSVNGLDNAERVATRVLSLPIHPYIGAETQERIAAELIRAVA
jgi:UDP-2-acetamido-2-deoxy-ribo-hexuluronate aminotransferase